MEFTKMGNKLETLIKWHEMKKRPEKSDMYLVIWHTPTGRYVVMELWYSKKYNLFGCGDDAKDAYDAIQTSERGCAGTHEEDLCGWYERDFSECFKKDGEF